MIKNNKANLNKTWVFFINSAKKSLYTKHQEKHNLQKDHYT